MVVIGSVSLVETRGQVVKGDMLCVQCLVCVYVCVRECVRGILYRLVDITRRTRLEYNSYRGKCCILVYKPRHAFATG